MGLKASSKIQQNELSDGLLIILLLISNVNCFYTYMCTDAHMHTHIQTSKRAAYANLIVPCP